MWSQFRIRVLELFRQPSFVVTTVVFPAMFFWFFALPNAETPEIAQRLMGSFSAFAILSVVVFQFAVYVATERASHWSRFLRTLPRPSWQHLVVFALAGLVFAALAVVVVLLVAHLGSDKTLPDSPWVHFLGVLFLAGIPFSAMGLFLGYLCSEKNVVPVANLVYLPLSFAGGLWIPPHGLPDLIQKISKYLPTRMYAEVVWGTFNETVPTQWNVLGLLLYFLLFSAMAYILLLRDEGQRFR